ncbi:MAG: hypothetical protein K6T29_10570 [Peptococcaceae bacterium]|nr:hypothetical protein [Peptococcaceae bacterium]
MSSEKIGAVMVVGGGVAGIQASLDRPVARGAVAPREGGGGRSRGRGTG